MSLLLLFHPKATTPAPRPDPGGDVRTFRYRDPRLVDQDDDEVIAAVIAFLSQQRH